MRLIDADALKDAYIKCPDHISFFDFGEIVELFLQAIDKQLTIAAPRWHRVEEPPKDEGKYLVCDGRGNYYVAWWGPRLGWCYDPKFFCYWMPIEPPKEE